MLAAPLVVAVASACYIDSLVAVVAADTVVAVVVDIAAIDTVAFGIVAAPLVAVVVVVGTEDMLAAAALAVAALVVVFAVAVEIVVAALAAVALQSCYKDSLVAALVRPVSRLILASAHSLGLVGLGNMYFRSSRFTSLMCIGPLCALALRCAA